MKTFNHHNYLFIYYCQVFNNVLFFSDEDKKKKSKKKSSKATEVTM